jgi:hypothetical protein
MAIMLVLFEYPEGTSPLHGRAIIASGDPEIIAAAADAFSVKLGTKTPGPVRQLSTHRLLAVAKPPATPAPKPKPSPKPSTPADEPPAADEPPTPPDPIAS